MPLNVIKGDMLIEAGNAGASESWYFRGEDITPTTVLNNQLRTVALARAEGLGKFAKVSFLRASDVAINRDSLVVRADFEGNTFSSNNAYNRTDNPGNCWHFRAEGQAAARRSFHSLFGPDGWFSRGVSGGIEVEASMETWRKNYRDVLKSQGALLRELDKAKGSNDPIYVKSMQNSGGFVQLDLRTVPGGEPGDFFQTYNFRDFRPTFSGRFMATEYSGDPVRTILLSKQYNFTALGTFLKAFVRHVIFVYRPLQDLLPIRPATKRVGRPFFLPVGRRRKASK